jgi:hypothetical protein
VRTFALLSVCLVAITPAVSLANTWSDACEATVLDYAYYRDRPDAQAVANLFTEDAVLQVLGREYAGREAIHERIVAGTGGPVFRHMMSTIRIFPIDADLATGVSYVTVYSAPRGDGPVPVDSFAAVGEYHDEFVRAGADCKIKRRVFVPVFLPPATP